MAEYIAGNQDVLKDGMPMPRRLIVVELERGQAAQDLIFKINKNLGANWVQKLAEPICDDCGEPITEDQENVGVECNLHKECAEAFP